MTQECRQVEILRPAVKELIRVEQTSRVPELLRRAFAVATSGRPGPGTARRARGCLPRRARFRRRGFCDRPDDVERACAAHPTGPRGHRPRRCFACSRQAAADPGWRRHSSLGGVRSAARARRGAVDPGRAHDERKGRHRLHPPALGGAVRPIFADCKRSDRGVGLSARRRLQARRDRHQALCTAVASRSRLFISRSSPRRSAAACPAEVALWGDARAGLEDLAEALAEDARHARATRADYVAEIPKRMAAWRDEAAAAD